MNTKEKIIVIVFILLVLGSAFYFAVVLHKEDVKMQFNLQKTIELKNRLIQLDNEILCLDKDLLEEGLKQQNDNEKFINLLIRQNMALKEVVNISKRLCKTINQ